MGPGEVMDVGRETLWVMVRLGAPAMAVAMGLGLAVSIVQALTQVQEATLSFVPKLLGVGLAVLLSVPWALAILQAFTESLYGRIAGMGGP
ncbi:flagellar biosynthetic protein FliQ [Marinimicrococcus flavescens]|uniref:Flagellar biosynthetic protein FliQ n=1 Tax=Marinimicrococcus flavescens TaxID=3031815 RepID=A0AAP3V1X0_9PROT|nr:flagellar biosynthetic protein FliQ [Marinimicrococcus flavescens]